MFTYDVTTPVGQVRLLIPDRSAEAHMFEDEELAAFLALEGSVRCAAALALETMAANEAYVQKAIRLLDLSTNGPATAAALLQRAAALRAQQAASGGEDIEVIPILTDPGMVLLAEEGGLL